MSSPTQSQRTWDVIVVGARAAGAATAMLLARAGLDVLVLERGKPGSDTLSTLALMRSGVMQLHRWGALDAIRAAGTPPVRQTIFHYGEASLSIDIKPAFGVDALYAPRRTVLDPILATAAQEAGADLRFRAAVDNLLTDNTGRVIGVAGRDAAGEPFEAESRLVIGADGTKSVVARSVEAPVTRPAKAAGGVIYGFFRGVESNAYEWYFNSGGEGGERGIAGTAVGGGIIPTNDNACCVFGSTSAERFLDEVGTDLTSRFHRILREVGGGLAERIAAAEPAERLRGYFGFESYIRKSCGPGWALVGDAGYFKDPITAHGISDALRDAEILARAAAEALADPQREMEALGGYETTRDELSEQLFDITEQIARYDWTLPEVQQLHHDLARSMKAENKHLAALEG